MAKMRKPIENIAPEFSKEEVAPESFEIATMERMQCGSLELAVGTPLATVMLRPGIPRDFFIAAMRNAVAG